MDRKDVGTRSGRELLGSGGSTLVNWKTEWKLTGRKLAGC